SRSLHKIIFFLPVIKLISPLLLFLDGLDAGVDVVGLADGIVAGAVMAPVSDWLVIGPFSLASDWLISELISITSWSKVGLVAATDWSILSGLGSIACVCCSELAAAAELTTV